MATTNPTDEKASTIEEAGDLINRRFLRILGVDEQNRQHCWKPATGEIVVRTKTGFSSEVHQRIDAGAKTRADYRVFVETETDLEMDWYEEAFE